MAPKLVYFVVKKFNLGETTPWLLRKKMITVKGPNIVHWNKKVVREYSTRIHSVKIFQLLRSRQHGSPINRDAGEGNVVLYATPNPFLLNKICLNQQRWYSDLSLCKALINWWLFPVRQSFNTPAITIDWLYQVTSNQHWMNWWLGYNDSFLESKQSHDTSNFSILTSLCCVSACTQNPREALTS